MQPTVIDLSRIVTIAPGDYPAWAPRVAPWIRDIADGSGGRLTLGDIGDGIRAGRYWLAAVMDGDTGSAPQLVGARSEDARAKTAGQAGQRVRAAVLAAPIRWPGGLIELEIIGIAGAGRHDWQDLETELRALARSLGFERIRALARPGWGRIMKRRGWYSRHIELECDL